MTDIKSSRLVEAFKAIGDGIYIINSDYTIEYMNSAMTALFGDGVGKKCYDIMNEGKGICNWCRFDDVFNKGETRYGEVILEKFNKTFNLIELPISNSDGTRLKLSIYRDITKTKEQEARLKSSEEDYKRLFEHAGCGVFISSKEGKFLDVNRTFLKMLGYVNRDNFLAMDIARDLYLKPEDRKEFMSIVEKQGRVVDYEVEWRRRDGHTIQVLLTSHVRYDEKGNVLGYEGIVVDQTQRKMMEEKMQKALNFLDQTINCSVNAIMAADLKGEVLIWNQGAEEVFGKSAEEVIGKINIREIYTGNLAKDVMKMIRSDDYGGKGKLKSYPVTFKDINGNETEGNLSAALLYDEHGNEIASVGIFVDLSERLAMERKLSETRQQLLQSEKLAAMGRLTSQLAHELNNPLFGIMNTLELMKTEISPQNKRRKLLDMSISETARLADMLRKMLSFSKPDQEEKRNVDINVLLDEIILLYEKRFRENSVKFTYEFAQGMPMVYASRDQLRQVFLNMISNAMDAMPDGGNLSINTLFDAKKVRVIITDTGGGIKEEHIEKIFDSFFTTKTDSVKGVGLGLSVCYGFVKEHGGDILVESKVGQGTSFTICLPVSDVPK
ncbi:PAS/PAC sensor signal transduction histidine kinase [Desulfamplus magnetovallimortis]|uniref:histidine kinase n=1 Tax=Desulfamplus magnetovallimortis TaxID=1246637 RepID=A0A1W1HCV0_9BACT|nr:PAS domain-containing sensor histidine kinase [Desulfamplus magnetovallimortis]SLM30321.1 PAS/PAC sensor signal transduction histidine kinase [Desulfamplus magnetovallimortis]